ncbi:Aor7: tungsten-containing aldehyde:ferredoxin oxidoreductase [Desulfosarcina variabilis str. Montpellier]|uniref:aldehyde ferredoxin oxidoreductase N-terminal domain-containing protein n=1 Tax=Desulfosarcina variabilis TaxID=2300 RepID=UPI003AFA8039
MKPIVGTSNCIVDVNLSTGAVTRFQVSQEERQLYLGGKGLGLALLNQRMDRGINPLGAENILAFVMSVFMGTDAPCSDTFSAVTKSPLTGLMLHSACEGPFGVACKTAGYDGVLVRGRASGPVVIVIDPNQVRIEDGSVLWGLDIHDAQQRMALDGKAGAVTIGPAGENQVRIANAASGDCYFGRGGLGAVMGSKNLKAILARGDAYSIVPANPKQFAKTRASTRISNCKTELNSDDCHCLGMLEPDQINFFNAHCKRLGLDCVSAAAVLAWCRRAAENGLIDTTIKVDTPGGIAFVLESMAYRQEFGDQMASGVHDLASQYGGGEFAFQVKGLEIAERNTQKSWGQGLAYAVANGGDCQVADAMAALEVELGVLNPYSLHGKAGWVKFFEDFYQALTAMVSCPQSISAHLLESPIIKYTPNWLLKGLMYYPWVAAPIVMDAGVYAKPWRLVTGLKLNRWQMLKTGARIHVLERAMNNGEGISRKDDTLPKWFSALGHTNENKPPAAWLPPMIDAYYRLRGYDLRGIPRSPTLKRLDISLKQPLTGDSRLANFKMASPGPCRMKRLYLSLMFWFMGRAIEAAFKMDLQVRQLFESVSSGMTFALCVAPDGPAMVVAKDKKGKVRYLDANISDRHIDLTLTIKNIEAAMLLFTFREAIATAIARDRLIVSGDIPTASIVVRVLERVEVYLLPKALAILSVRRYPELRPLRKMVVRGMIYLRALAGI